MRSGTAFINEFGRIRSGWRVVIFLIPVIVFTISATVALTAILIALGIDTTAHNALVMALSAFVSLVPAILFGWVCGRLLEGLPFRALGCWFTPGWLKNLLLGAVIGAGTIGVAVLLAGVPGGLSFTFDTANTSKAVGESLVVSLAVFALAAAFEEALFRGYVLQTLNRAGLGWLAIGLTSAFFGLGHLANPAANLISTTNTVLAGIWFGLAYLKTRDLWFPFGIHLMWNWMQGSILGIEVSGLTEISTAPLFNEIDRGPAWLTGEHYGIEASIACTIAILISIVTIYFLPGGVGPDKELLAMTSSETKLI